MTNSKKTTQPKFKSYFDVVVECTLPATIKYRVLAEDEDQALEMIEKTAHTSIKPDIRRKRSIKATVYIANTHMVKTTKTYNSSGR